MSVPGGRWTPARAGLAAGLLAFALHAVLLAAVPVRREFLKYPAAARLLAAGELAPERRVDFSPLYLDVHRAALRLAGEGTGGEGAAAVTVRWLQAAAVATGIGLLVALLARRFPPWLAGALFVVLAVDRHLLVYARILEPEAFLFAAVTAFVAALACRRPGPRQAALAGAAGAVALGLRPSVLPLLAAGLAVLVVVRPPRRGRGTAALLFALPIVVVMGFLALRAHAATGDARTPFMSPGTVFFEGNNPLSRGTSTVYPPVVHRLTRYRTDGEPDAGHVHYREVARRSLDAPLSVREVNAYWGGRALRFLADHPAHAVRLATEKLVHAFHAYRWHDVPTAFGVEATLPLPSFPFALTAALALVGLLVAAPRWRSHALFYLLVAAQLTVMVAFYVSARQRVVLLPALAWFAAVAVERLGRVRRRRLGLALLVLALAAVLSVPTPAVRDHVAEERAALRAAALADTIRQRLVTEPAPALRREFLALGALRPAWYEPPAYFPQDERTYAAQLADHLAADPAAPPFARATAALRAGRLDVAEALFRELASYPDRPYERSAQGTEPRLYLGRIAELRGDRAAAVGHLRAALAAAPGDPFVLAELVAVADDPAAVRTLARYWSAADAQLLVGEALLVHGRYEAAAAAFGYLVRRFPTLGLARLRLAEALARAGRDAAAMEALVAALRGGIEPAWGGEAMVPLVERWLAARPADPGARFLAARVLHLYGRYRLAAPLLGGLGDAPPVAAERRRVTAGLRALAATGG